MNGPPVMVAGGPGAAARMPESFAQDMAARNEYPAEWWYYHGQMRAAQQRFGFHLAFFRRRADEFMVARFVPLRWFGPHVRIAHFAMTDFNRRVFRYDHRWSLGPDAGASPDIYNVWMGDWSAQGSDGRHRLKAGAGDCELEVSLTPLKPFARIGDGKTSRADETISTVCLSCTRLKARGRLRIGDHELSLDGSAWAEHVYGTVRLSPELSGWDWFGLQLDDGRDILISRYRDCVGRTTADSVALIVDPDGRAAAVPFDGLDLAPISFTRSPRTGMVYPAGWMLRCSQPQMKIAIKPILRCNELDARGSTGLIYWEGPTEIEGKLQGRTVGGRGFAELVGYEPPGRLLEVYALTEGRIGLLRHLHSRMHQLLTGRDVLRTEEGWLVHDRSDASRAVV